MNDTPNPFQGANGEWLAARVGCATASRMCDVLDFKKDGSPGAARIKYLKELVAERMTGQAMEHYVTKAMQDGIDREPHARSEYETISGSIVRLTGFIAHPAIEYAGASPDGLIDHDGLVEIKCPTDVTHVDWLMAGVVPDQHKPQMLFQLASTRRQWCDFVSFSPHIRDERRRLFVRRFEPQPAEIEEIEEKVRAFLRDVDAAFRRITEAG